MQGKLKGVAYDIVVQALKSQNLNVKNMVLPWKRCLSNAAAGKVDLVPNASFKEQRLKFAHYSLPLYTTHLMLVYNKEKFKDIPKIQKISELHKFKIGGVLGFNYSKFVGVDIIRANSRKTLIDQLLLNRIDFAILQKEVFNE
ncbi:hypothetical protein BGC07_04390 [Piscirickettsia litoralis]|uniref:Solute-binding protein family 3/N-terminal domain-containing protein n=1 Tax=Piscirickettsia litoralis TaxID=1891921 RepID=A0ABX3A107_9GAMM|nr:hypothetical protein BGC07_04390 [Piscirickettsia litoralis]